MTRYQQRLADGQCGGCGRPSTLKRCLVCVATTQKSARKTRLLRKLTGVCRECGGNARKRRTRCASCAAKDDNGHLDILNATKAEMKYALKPRSDRRRGGRDAYGLAWALYEHRLRVAV